jgi:hypothetical protein
VSIKGYVDEAADVDDVDVDDEVGSFHHSIHGSSRCSGRTMWTADANRVL